MAYYQIIYMYSADIIEELTEEFDSSRRARKYFDDLVERDRDDLEYAVLQKVSVDDDGCEDTKILKVFGNPK